MRAPADRPPVLRPIRKGETYVRACEGGVVRAPAPSDGIVVDELRRDLFFSADEVRAVLDQLLLPAPRRAGR